MRRSILRALAVLPVLAWAVLAWAAPAWGQEVQPPRAVTNAFFAAGVISENGRQEKAFQIGGGVEGRVYKRFSLGAEFALLGPGPVALVSTNGFYHFPGVSASGKLFPFVTAGYTGAASLRENWFNLGGGVDYWFKRNLGLRVEFRDHVDTNHADVIHHVGPRIALLWRFGGPQ